MDECIGNQKDIGTRKTVAVFLAQASGTDKKTGATTYKVTLYDQDKKVFQGNAFSGGDGNPAIRDGNYTLRLDIRDPNGPRSLDPNSALNNPPQFWGIQKMDNFTLPNGTQVDLIGAYGHLRARLNPWVGADQGDYLHGIFLLGPNHTVDDRLLLLLE